MRVEEFFKSCDVERFPDFSSVFERNSDEELELHALDSVSKEELAEAFDAVNEVYTALENSLDVLRKKKHKVTHAFRRDESEVECLLARVLDSFEYCEELLTKIEKLQDAKDSLDY